jgi:hypothetical protein
MSKNNLFAAITLFLFIHCPGSFSQNIGIGTSSPNASALLHVQLNSSLTKGFLVTGVYNASATIPDLGSGSRLMFYPGKAAFRAGFIDAGQTQWNNANVGVFSAAVGYNTTASGFASSATGSGNIASGYASSAMGEGSVANNNYGVAMGYHAYSSGQASMAIGNSAQASGNSALALNGFTLASDNYAFASGYYSTASQPCATAMGYKSTASGAYTVALGSEAIASGYSATSIGTNTTASGNFSLAVGYKTVASGNSSTALGYNVNSNGKLSAVIFGDSDPNGEGITYSGYPDEFVARFWNGYYFLTSGTNTRFGVSVGHNGNAWVSICDKNQKENFQPLNGEEVLQKISGIPFSSWNYKQQDPKIYRHYGIMAQDFYNAFGHDNYGIIGNDTTVNPIDMIGIDMTAIQALEKRTTDLKNENTGLREENNRLRESVAALQHQFEEQQKIVHEILALTKHQTDM